MSKVKLLSVVVTTKNEAAHIADCIRAFESVRDVTEVIVVDNGSTDATREIAAGLGAKVLEKGPERTAQRNFGWRSAAADWIVILDADMIMPSETVAEMLSVCRGEKSGFDAYWIPEVRTGNGFRVKARNFERSFYDGTCIDALRLYSRKVLEATGGYDEALPPGGEDWELDIRILATGAKCAVLEHHLIHNEAQLSYRKMLEKKSYYTKGCDLYRRKWAGHPFVRRQFSPWYRFVGVFVEHGKWRKILRHPILFTGVMFERLSVAMVWLFHRGGK